MTTTLSLTPRFRAVVVVAPIVDFVRLPSSLIILLLLLLRIERGLREVPPPVIHP